jgi:hypothetical protein
LAILEALDAYKDAIASREFKNLEDTPAKALITKKLALAMRRKSGEKIGVESGRKANSIEIA